MINYINYIIIKCFFSKTKNKKINEEIIRLERLGYKAARIDQEKRKYFRIVPYHQICIYYINK